MLFDDDEVLPEVRAMVKGKALHHVRDGLNGFHSNNPRNASLAAYRNDVIDRTALRRDHRIFTQANAGKRAYLTRNAGTSTSTRA